MGLLDSIKEMFGSHKTDAGEAVSGAMQTGQDALNNVQNMASGGLDGAADKLNEVKDAATEKLDTNNDGQVNVADATSALDANSDGQVNLEDAGVVKDKVVDAVSGQGDNNQTPTPPQAPTPPTPPQQ